MNEHDMHNESHHEPLTPELSALSAALDNLAQHERSAAPPGLADRVYFRTAASLRAQPAAPARRLALGSFMRVAAVLALTAVGVIGVTHLSNQQRTTRTADLSILDAVLPPESADSWSPPSTNSLADVSTALESLETELDSFWSLDSNWLDDTSAGSI